MRGYAWMFGNFISLFTVIFGFFAILTGNGTTESEMIGWLLAIGIFFYLNYPGVQQHFVESETGPSDARAARGHGPGREGQRAAAAAMAAPAASAARRRPPPHPPRLPAPPAPAAPTPASPAPAPQPPAGDQSNPAG